MGLGFIDLFENTAHCVNLIRNFGLSNKFIVLLSQSGENLRKYDLNRSKLLRLPGWISHVDARRKL